MCAILHPQDQILCKNKQPMLASRVAAESFINTQCKNKCTYGCNRLVFPGSETFCDYLTNCHINQHMKQSNKANLRLIIKKNSICTRHTPAHTHLSVHPPYIHTPIQQPLACECPSSCLARASPVTRTQTIRQGGSDRPHRCHGAAE